MFDIYFLFLFPSFILSMRLLNFTSSIIRLSIFTSLIVGLFNFTRRPMGYPSLQDPENKEISSRKESWQLTATVE